MSQPAGLTEVDQGTGIATLGVVARSWRHTREHHGADISDSPQSQRPQFIVEYNTLAPPGFSVEQGTRPDHLFEHGFQA